MAMGCTIRSIAIGADGSPLAPFFVHVAIGANGANDENSKWLIPFCLSQEYELAKEIVWSLKNHFGNFILEFKIRLWNFKAKTKPYENEFLVESGVFAEFLDFVRV